MKNQFVDIGTTSYTGGLWQCIFCLAILRTEDKEKHVCKEENLKPTKKRSK